MKFYIIIILLLLNFISLAQNPGDVKRSKKIANNTAGMGNSISPGDNFGSGLTAIGDVNGDGVNDLAVGAAHYGTSGGVFILFMDTSGTVQSKTILAQNTNGISGLTYNGLFGYAVCSMGDINNDGIPDIGISEMNSSDGGAGTGAIYIVTLSSTGTALSQTKISKTTGYGLGGIPISVGKLFGTSMDTIGDLNNDGYNDLIVGGYSDSQAGLNKGAAYVLLLNSNHKVSSYYKIYDGVPNFNAPIDNNDYFGVSCCAAGDYDNDGVLDIIVGAHRDADEIINSGAFYIIHLNVTGTVKSYTKISNSSFLSANPFSSNSSRSLTTICDLDGNGTREIVSGVYRHDSDNGGVVIVFLDSNENTLNYNLIDDNDISSISIDSRFGSSVCFYENYNNDAYPEIVVGAYFENSDRGSVQIVSLKSNFNPTITKQNIQCHGDSTGIATANAYGAIPPFTYLWSNGSTTNTISNLTAGNYSVTVTNSLNDTATSTINITEAPEIILSTSNDTNICTNTSITISSNASGGTGNKIIYWSNTALNNNSQIITPTTSMDYYTWAIDANSCVSDTATISIGFSISSAASFTGLNMQQCINGNPVTLIGSPSGGSYSGNGISGNTFNPSIAGIGIHQIIYTTTDSIGCLSADTMYTLINDSPSTFAGNDTVVPCGTNGIQIGDSTEYLHTYLWSPYAGLDNPFVSNPTANPWQNTTFIITKTSLTTQCFSTDTVIVNIPSTSPTVSISGDTIICFGDTMHLIANSNPNVSYNWTNGSNQANFDEIVLASKYIVATVTDANNCKGIDSVYAVVNDLPNPFIGNDTTINKNQTLTLNAGSYQNFIWNTGEITQTIILDSNNLAEGGQIFSVFVTDNNSCVGSDSILINFITGIKELAKINNISIYPNPATDFVNIDWNSNIIIQELSIYDISGRLVFRKEISNKANKITTNISELSKGNYIIILKDNSDIKYGLQWIKN